MQTAYCHSSLSAGLKCQPSFLSSVKFQRPLRSCPPPGSKLFASSTQASPATQAPLHPAVLKRQQEAEARRLQADAQRAAQLERATTGKGWWETDLPVNMLLATSVGHLQETVQQANSQNKLVLVNFFAEDCYGCKSMQPKLKQIARDNPDMLFVKVNAGEEYWRPFCDQLGLERIPFFQLYKRSKLVSEFAANMRPEKLALLRAEIAAHKSDLQDMVADADTSVYADMEA